ncbi:hypothetical protein OG555_18705 [Kribbella sp. NBC_01484]|nr:hypothetical protein [Kribbella sp. NBC_01484]
MARVWRCGDGADVPEHHRFCLHRDTPRTVQRVVVVVWPPFGRVRRRGPA